MLIFYVYAINNNNNDNNLVWEEMWLSRSIHYITITVNVYMYAIHWIYIVYMKWIHHNIYAFPSFSKQRHKDPEIKLFETIPNIVYRKKNLLQLINWFIALNAHQNIINTFLILIVNVNNYSNLFLSCKVRVSWELHRLQIVLII